MYEENSMDFCITTLGYKKLKETGVLSLWKALISKSSGAPPRTPLGGSQRPPDPQLDLVNPPQNLSAYAHGDWSLELCCSRKKVEEPMGKTSLVLDKVDVQEHDSG